MVHSAELADLAGELVKAVTTISSEVGRPHVAILHYADKINRKIAKPSRH